MTGQPSAETWEPAAMSATFRAFLEEKSRFCDHLETLADLLPDGVDHNDCLLLARNMVPLVMRSHAFEEQVVFPYLEADPLLAENARQALERLKFEHIGDEDFANDLCLTLRDFVIDRKNANVETLAWMLRGFFEALRRHVAFEQQLILPLLVVQRS